MIQKRWIEAKVGGRWHRAKIREDAQPHYCSQGEAQKSNRRFPGAYPKARKGNYFQVEVNSLSPWCKVNGNRVVHEDCIREPKGKRGKRK